MKKYNVNDCGESQGCANETRPYNQVDELKNENEKLRYVLEEQKQELLQVYRRLFNQGY